MNSDLLAALRDLDAAEREALEDGFPIPSQLRNRFIQFLLSATTINFLL